ncbi:MAG: hypothetical protein M1839_004494 [Geoglossum umbratile]|nr:MAG: hypothetical protein M1839_004494 [Geoglossum umbratile]
MSRAESKPTWTHWAVLIGVGVSIDTTPLSEGDQQHRPRDRSLKGAVADITAVSDYLEAESHVKITKLTATKPLEGENTSGPIEASENLPTLDNVCSVLNEVIDEGARGQIKHVYIHFSGHGTRIGGDGPLALALYHQGARGTSHLRSGQLADALSKMVKHGMCVTLVLDCCFSGNVKRTSELHGSDIRFIEYDPVVDAESDARNPFGEGPPDKIRDSVLKVDQLLDPQGYTVITACSPSETASEMKFGSEARRGVLSYFLDYSLRLLRKAGTQITHQTLYHHLQARFHANYPQQTPMRYGSTDICFFQGLMSGSGMPFISVYHSPKDGRLILSAGEAHGVHERDEYEAHPYYASENPKDMSNRRPIKLQVQTVECLTSELVAVDPSHAERIARVPTWKAKPLTSFSPRKTRVHLMASSSDLDRHQLQRDLEAHPFLQLSMEENTSESSVFNVSLNTENAYEVQGSASCKIPNLSPLSRDGNRAPVSLTTMLGHLATFKFFEGMENQQPDPTFEGSFSLEPDCDVGQDGRFEVKHQSSWTLKFTNLSNTPIYITIFNFRPSWEVCNLVWEASGGDFLEITPMGHRDSGTELPLTMEVPNYLKEAGQRQSEDIVKVFITSKATSFPGMVLPKLRDSDVRGSPDQLSKFLESFTKGFCDTRDGSRGKWATRNFLIRTYIESNAEAIERMVEDC